MKKVIMFVYLFISYYGSGQEIELQSNGLIYSEKIMSKLTLIVDSLNLKHKICEINPHYFSLSQTKAKYIYLEKENIAEAMKDLNGGISFEDFTNKFPKVKIEKELLITKELREDSKSNQTFFIEELNLIGGSGKTMRIKIKDYPKKIKGTWLIEHQEKTKYSEESIEAFYILEEFKSIELPNSYSRMIGYSDCLIDTTSTKIFKDAEFGRVEMPENYLSLSEEEKISLLNQMRNTHVMGYCSMDASPRIHAFNIALLSAETVNWEVFLKAHLDIMNDRFDRQSDGSYAYGARKTYIKELEKLDIDIEKLIFGICFRFENANENHYFGNIGRLGRALAESQNRADIYQHMLTILNNKDLDDYNRMVFYFLIDNFNFYILDPEEKTANEFLLENTIKFLPTYMQMQLNERKN